MELLVKALKTMKMAKINKSSNEYKLRGQTKEELYQALFQLLPENLTAESVFFICIGSDRCTGDSFAPLVGTLLQRAGFQNVYGTLQEPIHAMNLNEVVSNLPKDKMIIAIDACLGQKNNIEEILFSKGYLKPGFSIGKRLPNIGDYNILGVVNVDRIDHNLNSIALQNTRLFVVMEMAENLVEALKIRFKA